MIPTPHKRSTIKLGTFDQGRKQSAASPTPPSHPMSSVDLRIAQAWIEAEKAHPGDTRAAVEAVTTVIERYRAGRRLALSDMWTSLPDWLRPALAKPAKEGLRMLVGDWAKDGTFLPAETAPERWRLTADEARVYLWEVDNGYDFEEIQREMTVKALRGDRRYWVPAEHVERLREAAHGKVNAMFGVA